VHRPTQSFLLGWDAISNFKIENIRWIKLFRIIKISYSENEHYSQHLVKAWASGVPTVTSQLANTEPKNSTNNRRQGVALSIGPN
jgi:hypothetical protein